jgi:hypothetical protein
MQKTLIAAVLFCMGLSIGSALHASFNLLIENETAISAMTPIHVAPWLMSLSESVREQLVFFLPVENLENFDTAISLLSQACINKKILSHLKVLRKSLHWQARQHVRQLRHDAIKSNKQGSKDIKRIKTDCAHSIRTIGARLKEAFDGVNLLEHAIKKSFKWFAHRRDVYNKIGRYKALVSVDNLNNCSIYKKSVFEKEINPIVELSCVLESLSKAYGRAQLALTVGGDV